MKDEIINIKARHRLFPCESLSCSIPVNINSLCNSSGINNSSGISNSSGINSSSGTNNKDTLTTKKKNILDNNNSEIKNKLTYPDLVACAVMVFPSLQNVVQFPSDTDEATAVSTAIAMKEALNGGTCSDVLT